MVEAPIAATPNAHVLIVEDEAVFAVDLEQTLAEFGFAVTGIASSADEAVARAAERRPDVVLMDIRIKGSRDGIAAATALREQFHVPVVFLTAHTDVDTLARARATRPFGYLTKPIRAAELRTAIEIALHRHAVEQQLSERERWFATTLQSIGDAVVAVDLEGRITFMNAEAESLVGRPLAAVAGRPAHEVIRLTDRAAGRDLAPLDLALAENRRISVAEAELVNAATGTTRIISDSATPVADEARRLGAVMVFRDVTDQKTLQRQLELADRLASLGTMAAGVAHEVNNPLTAVVGNTDLIEVALGELARALAAGDVADADARIAELRAMVADVSHAGRRIARIVADLRTFARPAPATAGTCDPARALEWALRTTEHECRLRARVSTEIAPLPHVVGDELRLGQVFVNLLVNAAQAIAPGAVDRNAIDVSARLDASGRVVVEVRDTGVGISADARAHVFDPFFTTKPVGGGTGLGLSISHGIVTSLGGRIELDSAPGRGTTVRVLLRAAEAQPGAAPEPPPAPAARPVRRARILAIDDEPMVLRAVQRILEAHDVVAVASAAAALALVEAGERFDLVLSDLTMPERTGIELYEILRASHPEVAERVVFVTGGAITAQSAAFLESVANQRIAKPFEPRALAHFVDTWLAARAGAP